MTAPQAPTAPLPPPPVAAVRAAWDTVMILGKRCPPSDQVAALARAAKAIEARGFTGQDMRRGFLVLLGSLAEAVFAPDHPAMLHAEGKAVVVINAIIVRFRRRPANRPYEDVLRTVLDLTAMGGDGLAWRDSQGGEISADEASALGRAVWLVADLNDAMRSRLYLSDSMLNEVMEIMAAYEAPRPGPACG